MIILKLILRSRGRQVGDFGNLICKMPSTIFAEIFSTSIGQLSAMLNAKLP